MTKKEVIAVCAQASLRARRRYRLSLRVKYQKPSKSNPTVEKERYDEDSHSDDSSLSSDDSEPMDFSGSDAYIDSEDEDDLDKDPSYVPESEEDIPSFTEEGVPVIQAFSEDGLHPILCQILAEDYSVLATQFADAVIVGDFQFVSKLMIHDAPRKSLYTVIRLLFPSIPLHYSTFLRKTVTIIQPRNRTDLCELCHQHELRVLEQKRGISTLSADDLQRMEAEFHSHQSEQMTQREAMKADKASVQLGEAVILMDYKESIKLPLLRDQEGHDFYFRTQISCLTFIVYIRKDGSCIKHAITQFSPYTSHTGLFTVHSINALLRNRLFEDIDTITFWSDGGPHFRCREVVGTILGKRLIRPDIDYSINFFSPHHGKSEVDGIFGFFSHLIHDWLPRRGIRDIDSLLSFFRNATTIVELSSISTPVLYEFEMFAFP